MEPLWIYCVSQGLYSKYYHDLRDAITCIKYYHDTYPGQMVYLTMENLNPGGDR